MERRRLGSSDLNVGVIGMGTWRTFDVSPSSRSDMAVRRQIVEEALSCGVNFFDSSPMYGAAEEVLGRSLAEKRGDVYVATKVWSSSVAEGRRQMERALAYYGGYVDLYQVHNLVAWREYLPILRQLKEEGRVGAVGVTHYSHSAFPDLAHIIEREDISAVQIPYNAADHLAAERLLPLAQERDVGVIVMSPLGTGSLLRSSPPASELAPLQRFGVETWAQALLKWIVSDPRVHVTIPATSRPGRMAENSRAGDPPFFGPAERERVSWLAARA